MQGLSADGGVNLPLPPGRNAPDMEGAPVLPDCHLLTRFDKLEAMIVTLTQMVTILHVSQLELLSHHVRRF